VTEPRGDLFAGDFDRGSIVAVRRAIERHSERAGLTDPELHRFVVAVNEIVTNAVRHGGGSGRVRLWLEGARLHCRVTDSGAGIPPERRRATARPAPDTVGGWGLWLARQGCDALTVDAGAGEGGAGEGGGTTGSVVTLVRSVGRPLVADAARPAAPAG